MKKEGPQAMNDDFVPVTEQVCVGGGPGGHRSGVGIRKLELVYKWFDSGSQFPGLHCEGSLGHFHGHLQLWFHLQQQPSRHPSAPARVLPWWPATPAFPSP